MAGTGKDVAVVCKIDPLKNVLIIYPHWPPSNLAGVHRARLLANFLPEYGWQPILLTVKPEFYEEKLDLSLEGTVSPHIIVHRVNAFPVNKRFRLIGDIGLRSFIQLYRKAVEIIRHTKIDAILIPIPIYYTALLGPLLYWRFKIPFGIDYIDPWSDGISGREKVCSRGWVSNLIAKTLEPISLLKVSFVTGVSSAYYQYIFDRKWVRHDLPNIGMPYGFDPKDHEIQVENIPLPWEDGIKPLIYAGAFLPKSHEFLQKFFEVISSLKSEGSWPTDHRVYFLGTGPYQEKSIESYAKEAEIGDLIVEIRDRYPFLHILNFLHQAKAVLVIGTSEKHYTASKTFQAILSKKPVFSILHQESTAATILSEVGCGSFSALYSEGIADADLKQAIKNSLLSVLGDTAYQPDLHKLQPYSASNSSKVLSELLNNLTA